MIARVSEPAATARPLPLVRRQDLAAGSLNVRGQRWWRLKDPIRMRFWQFGEEEYFLWSQLEAGVSLDELQQRFAKRFGPRRIELSHLHQFLGALHREGLVYSTARHQSDVLLDRDRRKRIQRRYQSLTNLLAIRFRGVDPSRFLEWLYPRAAWLFAPWIWVMLGLLVCSALVLAVCEFETILARLPQAREYLTPINVIWLAVTMGALKGCHELGHALTCRHFGGRCHELGVMLLVFTPCLYCNVSDAWLLPNRWRRMAISGAGICVELVLAAVATWLWWFSEPGLFSTLCLNVMVIGSINTLMFNGNPLLRFDGYFLLSDFLDQPNLRQAGDEWLRDWLGRMLLGIVSAPGRSLANEGHAIVPAYAVAAAIYRWFLTVLVWWCVYQWFAELQIALVGAALVALSAAAIFGQTVVGFGQLYRSAWRNQRLRLGRAAISPLVAIALLGALAIAPLPRRVTAPAVLLPANAATIYVSRSGRLLRTVPPGTVVKTGDPLAWLRNDELEQDLLRLSNERDVLQRQVDLLTRQQLRESRSLVTDAAARLKTTQRQLADVIARCDQKRSDQEQLTLRSPCDGMVLSGRAIPRVSESKDLPRWQGSPLDARNAGCYLEAGEIFCLVGDRNCREALVAIEQSEVRFVEVDQAASVQLDELPGARLHGMVCRVDEMVACDLPPELLTPRRIPLSVEAGKTQQLGTYFPVTLSIVGGPQLPFGSSGYARIRVTPQSLAERLYSTLCRTFSW